MTLKYAHVVVTKVCGRSSCATAINWLPFSGWISPPFEHLLFGETTSGTLGDGEGVGIGVGVGAGVTETETGFGIVTLLSQTNFLPDLIQVNFFPLAVAVSPALVKLPPAFGVAAAAGLFKLKIISEKVDDETIIDLDAIHMVVI